MAKNAAELHDIFNLMDEDAGGSISFEEIEHFCSALPDNQPDEADIRKLINRINPEGEIDQDQFLILIEELPRLTKVTADESVAAFKQLCYRDLFCQLEGGDGSGSVRKTDLFKLVSAMEIGATDDDIRKVFLKYDEDGSGEIEIDEFVGIVTELARGVPLSHCVQKFKIAQENKKRWFGALHSRFDDGKKGTPKSPAVPPPEPVRAKPRPKLVPRSRGPSMVSVKSPGNPSLANPRSPLKELNTTFSRFSRRGSDPVLTPLIPPGMQIELDEAKKRIRELEQDNETLRNRCDDLERIAESGSGDKDARIAALERDIRDLEERLQKKGGGDAAADAKKLRQLQQECDDKARKNKVLEGKLEHLTRASKEMEAKMASRLAMQMSQRQQAWEKGIADRDAVIQEINMELEMLRQTGGGGDNSEQLAEMYAELQARDHTIAQLEQQVLNLQGQTGGEAHVWTLERALEIRSNELERMHVSLLDFAVKVSTLDRQLAEAMKGVVSESKQQLSTPEANPETSAAGNELIELRAEVERLRAEGGGGGGGGGMDAEEAQLLQMQVWTLEQALEIRTRENERLTNMIEAAIAQVAALDAQLAEQLRKALHESSSIRQQEEEEALGQKVEDALADVQDKKEDKKKRKAKKKRKSSVDESADVNARAEELAQKEADRLRAQLQKKDTLLQQLQAQARQKYMDWAGAAALGNTGGPMGFSGFGPGGFGAGGQFGASGMGFHPGAAGAAGVEVMKGTDGRVLNSLGDYQEEIRRLSKQLEAAQRAIIAGTQYGWQRDLKLGEARRALTRMLESHGEWLCVGKSSPVGGQAYQSASPFQQAASSSMSPSRNHSPTRLGADGLPQSYVSWRDRALAAASTKSPVAAQGYSSIHTRQSHPGVRGGAG